MDKSLLKKAEINIASSIEGECGVRIESDKIIPEKTFFLAEIIKVEQKHKSGLHIISSSEIGYPAEFAMVIRIGKDVKDICVGDIVIVGHNTGHNVNASGERYKLYRHEEHNSEVIAKYDKSKSNKNKVLRKRKG